MSLQKTIEKSVDQIPECVAGGYVDLTTGMLLGIDTVDSHPKEVIDMLAAATADLFQGPNVVAIENMFKKSRGMEEDDHHYFQEMLIFSDNLLHVFLRTKKYPDHVICFVTRKSANVGMVLTKSRMMISDLEEAL